MGCRHFIEKDGSMDAGLAEALAEQASEVMAEVILEPTTLLSMPTLSPTLATPLSSFNAPNEVVLGDLPDSKPPLEEIPRDATLHN